MENLQFIWHSVFEIEHLLHSSIDGHGFCPFTEMINKIESRFSNKYDQTSPIMKNEIKIENIVKKREYHPVC